MDIYRKKPVEVEAVRFRNYADAVTIMDWATGIYFVPRGYEHPARYGNEYDRSNGHTLSHAPCFLVVKTLEGSMRADQGDWIIKGVAGEFYPCKDSIFRETYEEVGGPEIFGEES